MEKYIETLSTKVWSNELYKDTSNNMNKRLSKIMQLRKDIKEGKIFTIYDGNGKFVWKKIR